LFHFVNPKLKCHPNAQSRDIPFFTYEINKKGRTGRKAKSLIAFGNSVIGKDEQRQVSIARG